MSKARAVSQRSIPFTKASAAGNDFIIVRQEDAPSDLSSFCRKICDRTQGVGADGVEFVSAVSDGTADVRAHLINSDGSEAELSGNGTRCVAAYWNAMHGAGEVKVLTGAGVKLCQLVKRDGDFFEFEIQIGTAALGEEENIFLEEGEITGWPVNIGNPHCVIFVRSFEFSWQRVAAEVQSRIDRFPNGTNVEFVHTHGEHKVEARFFERGAGETRSSGTGSCAAALAAIASGRCSSPVAVIAPGGTQTVRVKNKRVSLQGIAHLICEGAFFI